MPGLSNKTASVEEGPQAFGEENVVQGLALAEMSRGTEGEGSWRSKSSAGGQWVAF